MIIAITGTPGTGKTAAARILARLLNARLVGIKELVKRRKLKHTYDAKRKTKEIGEKELIKAVAKEIQKGKTNIVEGHLSHLVRTDCVFILRCNPRELRKRLEKRKWGSRKIKENVLAEFLDIISAEALWAKRKVFEVDTSSRSARQTAELMRDILNSYSLQKKYRARIDWTEKYKNLLKGKMLVK